MLERLKQILFDQSDLKDSKRTKVNTNSLLVIIIATLKLFAIISLLVAQLIVSVTFGVASDIALVVLIIKVLKFKELD
jgi:hypothetical protein